MPEPTTDRLDLTLASELDSVATVEETCEKFAQRAGFDEDTVSGIAMVAHEAAVNAVLHGNRKDPEKAVTASFALTDHALTICIADEGGGFDADTLPDPVAPENLLRSSGRGVFLMRAVMDEVHFRKLAPGTEVTLIKHRN